MAIAFDELFEPDFLSSLTHLSIQARRVAAGGRYGERLSKQAGSGLEFKDYRPYTVGDDLRAIDWNIYRRLGRVFIRLFEEQQELSLYLMPDQSRSMYLDQGMETSPRVRTSLRAALALAAISMNHHDTAGLFPFGDQLEVICKSKSGKTGIMSFARHLAALEPQTNTHLAESIRKLASMNLRPGLLVIISDFFDPTGLKAITKELNKVRHKLLLVQLVRATDADPNLQGEYRLEDCESGEAVDIAMSPAVIKRYQEAYQRFNQELADYAKRRHAGLLRLDADGDVVEQLSTLFESGALRV